MNTAPALSQPADSKRDLLAIYDQILSGHRISRDQAIQLYHTAPLARLGELARINRNKFNPENRVTFLIDRNINYTNVCNSDCSFCAFYRHDPQHPEAYVLSREILTQKITEALSLGATRILLQGGHNDELPYSFYVELVDWISTNFAIEINAFSPSEIQQMVKVSGKSAREVLLELQAHGLKGLPGGGAEILDDEIRIRVSPKKIRTDDWIAMMEIAQDIGLTTTASMVLGFGETIENRLNHFDKLRDLQDRTIARGKKGFGCFISWPLQFNENTSLGRSRHVAKFGASAVEYLRMAALGRIYLDNIPHHQSSWPTLGPDIAQIGLHFGLDDIGSTMMEENVVSQAGAKTKDCWSLSPTDLISYIHGAGFKAAQRDSSFNIVKIIDPL